MNESRIPARSATHRDRPRRRWPKPTATVTRDVEARLVEAEETLRAIRNGEVDALVVRDESTDAQVFTLSSADRPYRMFVEKMRDGAATLSPDGIVLYANRSLAALVARPLEQLIGMPIESLLAEDGGDRLRAITGRTGGTIDLNLITSTGGSVPSRINTSVLDVDAHAVTCVTFADLTQQNAHKIEIERLQAVRVRELELGQEALTEQATHDALTGLANRSLLIDRIGQALALSQRLTHAVGLIFVDLDDFKLVNDTHGHAAGDTVLRAIAERLRNTVRPMDSVARLGGDEFIVLLPAVSASKDAVDVARRIAVAINLPIELAHGVAAVTASVGVAVVDPENSRSEQTAEGLIQQADSAMYHAKSFDGSRVELYETGTTPSDSEANRQTWVARIRQGLEEERFVLHAQPIVDLRTGVTIRHELLLRLRARDGRLIAPLTFLPTAERSGLIKEIDEWVIGQAVGVAATGRSVAINISAASAANPVVLDLIERALADNPPAASNMMFEITETAVMNDIERGRQFAERVLELGCSFALDDFGSGFASFTYLKRLPAQYLKIDIEFVRELAENPQDKSVVSAIVALAHGFGQQTIAEGVETEAAEAELRRLGVDFAQGYLFGAPAPLVTSDPAGALLHA
jgi:diguanylate cyclase (GGDEF)-like protein